MNINLNGLILPTNVTEIRPTKGGVITTASLISLSLPTLPLRYLYSGWQSWSLTAWVDVSHPLRPIRPSSMNPMQCDPLYANDPRPHGSWYGVVELPDGKMIFLGALGLGSHVMLDAKSFVGWYESGNGEWFIANGEETDFMANYADLLGNKFGYSQAYSKSITKQVQTSQLTPNRIWCSWYSLYTEIYETQLLKILSDLGSYGNADGFPINIFQVDDGWQINIGDWEPNNKFPSGMEYMATRINATCRKAGLWLAPLLATTSSNFYRDHPEWLLHDESGKLVSAGFNWSEQLYALDTTHPAVLDWLTALMKKVRRWGYDYIKLDFLYAGALPGKRYDDIPREAAYRMGLNIIREALGDAYLLTCGAPILPSLGLCDGMRIGPDVAGHWTNVRDDELLMNFAIPGTRNALRTTFNRLWLHTLTQVDPDVAYFRSCLIDLTSEQKSLLQDMAQICNFKATSDIPAWLTGSERSTLIQFLTSSDEVTKLGNTVYQVGERQVDFTSAIEMPPLPGLVTNLEGIVVAALANRPSLMKVFDNIGKNSLKKMLKLNPV
jgi:alpha-galactosidase